jgi:uncharacterized protein RhaS with RHS repeats
MKALQRILFVAVSAMFLTTQAQATLFFARAYDPNLARWITRDPIGEQGGLNLYVYVYNNPINYIDPLGFGVLSPEFPMAGGDGGGAGGEAGMEAASAEEMANLQAQAEAEAVAAAAAKARGECPKAGDLMGRSAKDIAKMLQDMGWKGTPTRTLGGMRYANPNKPGEQVRIMPGNPNDPNPAKQGPYVRVSTGGTVSDPTPISP